MRYVPLLVFLAGCASWFDSPLEPPPPPPPPPPPLAALQSIGTFVQPTFLTAPPGDSTRILVTERRGLVQLVKQGILQNRPFLDLRGKINAADENGLFSLAFHPQYQTNGRFYAFYTNLNGDIRVVRYVAWSNRDSADAAQSDTILAVPHPVAGTNVPYGTHHGGQLQFGPADGMLYVSLGDGGCCGDPFRNGQRTTTVNGKLIRIDVNGPTGYTIPPDNPYVTDTNYPPETWAMGFRNPWRFSFDKITGDLYIADVGDGSWEEVNAAAGPAAGKGLNYGWNIFEGTHCVTGGCSTSGLTMPVTEYGHTSGACSVTGGYVYRGTRVTQLIGHYLYADFCSGFVRSFRFAGGQATEHGDWTSQLSPGGGVVSFGEDARGDVYIVTYSGPVYRIVAP